ncbi:conserved hypothetical protein [Ricinus communis]|uniref:Uncharacterized protein n=1 Tax=Ricinus communis TaxID=3988 RepID=B9RFZ0_RICCO|nr:conserved hypothetical protein [Ricinus communis]
MGATIAETVAEERESEADDEEKEIKKVAVDVVAVLQQTTLTSQARISISNITSFYLKEEDSV